MAAVSITLLELDEEVDVGGDKHKARASHVVEIAVAERAEQNTIIYVAEGEDGKKTASAIQGKLSVSLGRCAAMPTRVDSVVEGLDLVARCC